MRRKLSKITRQKQFAKRAKRMERKKLTQKYTQNRKTENRATADKQIERGREARERVWEKERVRERGSGAREWNIVRLFCWAPLFFFFCKLAFGIIIVIISIIMSGFFILIFPFFIICCAFFLLFFLRKETSFFSLYFFPQIYLFVILQKLFHATFGNNLNTLFFPILFFRVFSFVCGFTEVKFNNGSIIYDIWYHFWLFLWREQNR